MLSHGILAAAIVSFSASSGFAESFSARLNGFNELGALNNETGAILSNGTGTVSLRLNQRTATIDYTLNYSDVGTTPPKTGTVSQAHIHFGKSHNAGGVLVFFCTNLTFLGTGPKPPACPTHSGTVSGTWTQANVQAITSQNVTAGDFNALLEALASDTAYANVHTTSGTAPDTAFPAGEIRGQCRNEDQEDGEETGGGKDRTR